MRAEWGNHDLDETQNHGGKTKARVNGGKVSGTGLSSEHNGDDEASNSDDVSKRLEETVDEKPSWQLADLGELFGVAGPEGTELKDDTPADEHQGSMSNAHGVSANTSGTTGRQIYLSLVELGS
jgi:hypothetical protein